MSEGTAPIVSAADIKFTAPDQLQTIKTLPDIGALVTLGAFGLALVTSEIGLLSLAFVGTPLALGLSAVLGVASIAQTGYRMATTGRAAEGDDATTASCKAAFNKEARGNLLNQGISVAGSAVAYGSFAGIVGSVLAGDGAGALLCAGVYAISAGAAAVFNFRARHHSSAENAYDNAIHKHLSAPQP